jgi:hypothetical protein
MPRTATHWRSAAGYGAAARGSARTMTPRRKIAAVTTWTRVRALLARHMATPFPDCRGEEIDGVDLVMADADVVGCVLSLVSSDGGSPHHARILCEVAADLDRVLPVMPAAWSAYFAQVRELAATALDIVDAR